LRKNACALYPKSMNMASYKRRHVFEGFIIYLCEIEDESNESVNDSIEDTVAKSDNDDYISESEQSDVIFSISKCLRT
jgi:hypothetical protein